MRPVAPVAGAGMAAFDAMGIIIRLAVGAVSLWIATVLVDGISVPVVRYDDLHGPRA